MDEDRYVTEIHFPDKEMATIMLMLAPWAIQECAVWGVFSFPPVG